MALAMGELTLRVRPESSRVQWSRVEPSGPKVTAAKRREFFAIAGLQ